MNRQISIYIVDTFVVVALQTETKFVQKIQKIKKKKNLNDVFPIHSDWRVFHFTDGSSTAKRCNQKKKWFDFFFFFFLVTCAPSSACGCCCCLLLLLLLLYANLFNFHQCYYHHVVVVVVVDVGHALNQKKKN